MKQRAYFWIVACGAAITSSGCGMVIDVLIEAAEQSAKEAVEESVDELIDGLADDLLASDQL